MMTTRADSLQVDQIHPGRWQPRFEEGLTNEALEDLAKSIETHGVLNAVIVVVNETGQYELVAGERRLRAAVIAGLGHVPVNIVTGTEAEIQEIALIDNVRRLQLTPLEEARGIQMLMDVSGFTTRAVAIKLGWSQGLVAQRLSLLKLDPNVAEDVDRGEISPTVGRALSTMNPEAQVSMASEIRRRSKGRKGIGLTASGAENLIRKVRDAMQPVWWDPPFADGEILNPKEANQRRVVAALIELLPHPAKIEAITTLLDQDLVKEPAKLTNWQYEQIWTQLLDIARKHEILSLLDDLRQERNWSCETCRMSHLPCPEAPYEAIDRWPCEWWNPEKEELEIDLKYCWNWIPIADLPMIEMNTHSCPAACKGCKRTVPTEMSWRVYCRDWECWIKNHFAPEELVETEKVDAAVQAAKVRTQAAIFEYMQIHTLMSLDWPCQGACKKCYYSMQEDRQTIGNDNLQCRWMKEGLAHKGGFRPPEFYWMVSREDGHAVPMCKEWRVLGSSLIPDVDVPEDEDDYLRDLLLFWVEKSYTDSWQKGRWLPDSVNDPEEERSERVQRFWDWSEQLTNGQLAWMLSEAMIRDITPYSSVLELVNPGTHEVEEWEPMQWEELTVKTGDTTDLEGEPVIEGAVAERIALAGNAAKSRKVKEEK